MTYIGPPSLFRANITKQGKFFAEPPSRFLLFHRLSNDDDKSHGATENNVTKF